MTELTRDEVTVTLPTGWEGRITSRAAASTEAVAAAEAAGAAEPEERTVVLQVATFPLPADMGDFGGGATATMGIHDVLVVLFEYGSGAVGTPLFAAEGLPRLRTADYTPYALRTMLEGQTGVQRFFTLGGRAFCLYVVLGSHRRRVGLSGLVNVILQTIRIG